MRPITSAVLALLCAAVGACAASNPERTNVPAPWTPVPPAKTPAPAEGTAQSAQQTPADATKPAATAKSGDAADARAPTKSDDVTDARETSDPLIARVGDEDVHLSELLGRLLYRVDLYLLDELDALIVKYFADLEAQRLRVRIDPDGAAQAYDDSIRALEATLAKQRPGVSLDRWVDRGLGLDPIRFREHVREEARFRLLIQRVARAWVLQHEHVESRLIVVDDDEKLKAAQQELADGVAFEEVARQHSIDSSKDQGGLLSPIVGRNTAIGRLAFDTPVGTIAAPLLRDGNWLLMRVEARHEPLEGDWSRIGPQVEESLKQRPLEPPELQQWREAMIDRYPVDERPLFELVHGPAR